MCPGDLVRVINKLSFAFFVDPGSGFPTGETCKQGEILLVVRVNKTQEVEVLAADGRLGWIEWDDVEIIDT